VICAVLCLQQRCHPFTVYKINSFFYTNICSFIAVGSNVSNVSNCVTFNHNKSVCMIIGPNRNKLSADMFLGSLKLEWVTSFKYLGIVFNSACKISIDTSYIRKKFYASCNGILAYCKSADEFIRFSLVKLFYMPLLCYCLGALGLLSQQVKTLAVCWNNCFRRIFGFKRFESVKCLQFYCNELPFTYMFDFYK